MRRNLSSLSALRRRCSIGGSRHKAGTRVWLRAFPRRHRTVRGPLKMDQRDQDLLRKQVGRLTPAARNDGVLILATLVVFFGGVAIGGFLFGNERVPTRIAFNDAPPAASYPIAPPTMLP